MYVKESSQLYFWIFENKSCSWLSKRKPKWFGPKWNKIENIKNLTFKKSVLYHFYSNLLVFHFERQTFSWTVLILHNSYETHINLKEKTHKCIILSVLHIFRITESNVNKLTSSLKSWLHLTSVQVTIKK